MSNEHPFGVCAACGQALQAAYHAFALQQHRVTSAELDGPQGPTGTLEFGAPLLEARFCSKACCQGHLPPLLELYGLPPTALHTLVGVGPLHPCAHCAQPVLLTRPHGAWVWGERRFLGTTSRSRWEHRWLDVMAVICDACGGVDQARTRRGCSRSDREPRLHATRTRPADHAHRDGSRILA
jgi:hypothetical protein